MSLFYIHILTSIQYHLTFISVNNTVEHIQSLFCPRVVGERHAVSTDLFKPVEVKMASVMKLKDLNSKT